MPPETVDELFEVKNAYYLGNYQQCVTEAQKLRPKSDENKLVRDAFLYRAYIALKKYSIPLDEINKNSAVGLQAVRMYAEFLGNESKKRAILSELESKANAGVSAENSLFFLMSGYIYMKDGNYDSALRMLHQTEDLECGALTVQCLLKLDRVDLALKEVKKLQERDEDSTITQLALAWTNLSVGKEKLQDAFYIFQEMVDKYGETPLLLVGQSACMIQQGKYAEAETLLQNALQKDPNNAEALINMITVSQQLGKPFEVSNRYVNQLKDGHPDHPWTRDFIAAENLFNRVAQESA